MTVRDRVKCVAETKSALPVDELNLALGPHSMTAAPPQKYAEFRMRRHLDNHAGVVKVVNHHGSDVLRHEAEGPAKPALDVFGSHIDVGTQWRETAV